MAAVQILSKTLFKCLIPTYPPPCKLGVGIGTIGLLYTRHKKMIPKLEQHQLLIVYSWNEISFLGLCCWSKEFRSAISPVEEFFCASTYLRVNTFFVYSQLTLHTDRARTLHTPSNHSEVAELCALCQTLHTSAFTQILEYIQIYSIKPRCQCIPGVIQWNQQQGI